MADDPQQDRWQTDGKFFRAGTRRVDIRAVTYGPFPSGWPTTFAPDFQRIAAAGFNAIRLYQMPDRHLLDAASRAGLSVFGGLSWEQNADFIGTPSRFSAARIELADTLAAIGSHPALAGVYVANEIPADLVRWMGPLRVRQALESLIELGREIAPQLLFAYANYPSTEYLEPGNADFTAFNIYLEDEAALRGYLKRLHHIAGDRPLVVSEFGLDSRSNSPEAQAKLLTCAARMAHEEDVAGFTIYAWSDRWLSGGIVVNDWDFGLTDRDGNDKPALTAIRDLFTRPAFTDAIDPWQHISVVICTRNGRGRIGACLDALQFSGFQRMPTSVVVVDDGSTDGTADFVESHYPWVRLLRQTPAGLSAARNAGARLTNTEIIAFTDDDCVPDREWLLRLTGFFISHPEYAAAGGPNLPQRPETWREAVVCAAPGAPSHVMLDDQTAEHLPGCNIAVRRQAFDAIRGFDPQFHTAGDDVDFCWRLQEAGYQLGFNPGAFVWHWRRPTLRGFLKQQIGYGKAEHLLIAKHPQRFTHKGSAIWQGFIYGGAPVRVTSGATIYHGDMGSAGYQSLVTRMQPVRVIDARFRSINTQIAWEAIIQLSPLLRGWFRCRRLSIAGPPVHLPHPQPATKEIQLPGVTRQTVLDQLLADGWQPCGPTAAWDLEKDGTRILVATELGELGAKRTLIRIDGDASLFDAIRSGCLKLP